MALAGRVILYIGLFITIVSFILGFGLMFNDYDKLAQYFLMAVPFGFVFLFVGVSTIVMFSPRESEK